MYHQSTLPFPSETAETKICVHCGTSFERNPKLAPSMFAKKLYCTPACRHRADSSRWAKKHPDKQKSRSKAWRQANRDYDLAKKRTYARENDHRPRWRRWYAKNADKVRDSGARRRARRRNAPNYEWVTKSQIIDTYGLDCYLCGRTLLPEQVECEHVIPLSRGGEHSLRNHRPACRECNQRKRNKLPDELPEDMAITILAALEESGMIN